jgi:hypothetical protein
VHIEDTFDVIKRAHIATGHGGRNRMVKELGKKYANVTRDSIHQMSLRCARNTVSGHRWICDVLSTSQHHHTVESHTWTEDNNLGVN